MRSLAIGLTLCLSLPAQLSRWHSDVLDSGVRVSVLHIPDAPLQTTFVFLPRGLVVDAPHQAQFAHLLEHMLIRSVNPDGFETEGIRYNGETTALALRLEMMAPRDKWRRSIEKLADWLTVGELDAVVLEVEKERIAAEEEGTVANGMTHKWASAAWNQVINHGLEHVALHGDVASVDVARVQAFARSAIRASEVSVFSVGPIAPEDVVAAVGVEFVLPSSPEAEAVTVAASALSDGVDVEATWDLDGTHFLQWYDLPCGEPADRAAAWVAANQLNLLLQNEPRLRKLQVTAIASADFVSPNGLAVGISVAVPKGVDVADLRAGLADIEKSMQEVTAAAAFMANQLAAFVAAVPDLGPVRARLGARADLAEPNIALSSAYQEIRAGVPLAQLPGVYRSLTRDAIEVLYRNHITAKKRRTLVLRPGR